MKQLPTIGIFAAVISYLHLRLFAILLYFDKRLELIHVLASKVDEELMANSQ